MNRAVSTRRTTTAPPAPPIFTSFREKALWREANGIVAVGPATPAPPKPLPTVKQMQAADKEAVHLELKAIDRRLADIASMLDRTGPGLMSPELAETTCEYRQLFDLRRAARDDLEHPVDHDGEGRPLDVRQRMIRKERAGQLRLACFAQSEKFRAEGLYREARRWRLDSLRARALAESELGWRPHPGTFW